jgi:hypothetical protein
LSESSTNRYNNEEEQHWNKEETACTTEAPKKFYHSTHLNKGTSIILEVEGADASNLVRRVTVAYNAPGSKARMPTHISKVTDDFPHIVNWSGNDTTVVDFGKEYHDV